MPIVLVTGGTGQVARALAAQAPAFERLGCEVRVVGRPQFDFDRLETVDACLREIRPGLVVNAAAWTAVDAAETQADAAARANDSGPAHLGAVCAAAEIPLLHLSTDYVFDGTKGTPYRETDRPNPQSVYGATKLAGERKILAQAGPALILRSSWIYAAEGKNFLRTMLNAAQRSATLRVVSDQLGCPTNADDLATAILQLVERIGGGWRDEYRGVLHAAGSGDTSWFGFADAIFEAASRFGLARPAVEPITTADWPTPARRPPDSRLDCRKLSEIFGISLPPWRESLERTIPALYRKT